MNKYIATAAAAILLAACTNDDTPAVDVISNHPITVNAGVAEVMTRAGMTGSDLTTLGLTITNTAEPTYSYTNLKYEKGSGTTFVPATGVETPLWQNAKQEVTVSAWSPYVEGDVTNYTFTVAADQSTANAAKASDFLWVKETVDPDGEQTDKKITYQQGGILNIALQHALSKLVVNLRSNNDAANTTLANAQVVVKGLENSCLFNLNDGTMTALATSVKQDIIPYAESANSYEAIFPPQNSAFNIMITLDDGRKFLHENAAFDFQAGYAYTLGLIVGKDKVEIAGITAAPWRADTEENKYLGTE